MAFKYGRQVFFLGMIRTVVRKQDGLTATYFKTDDCSGQAFLRLSISPSSPKRMTLLASLVGEEGTVWVADPNTVPEAIDVKSRWDNNTEAPGGNK